jgi:hypothetical protein
MEAQRAGSVGRASCWSYICSPQVAASKLNLWDKATSCSVYTMVDSSVVSSGYLCFATLVVSFKASLFYVCHKTYKEDILG